MRRYDISPKSIGWLMALLALAAGLMGGAVPTAALASGVERGSLSAAALPDHGPPVPPIWSDSLDGKADSGGSGFTGPQTTSPASASRGVSWEKEGVSQYAKLGSMDSYIGYVGSRLKAAGGSILFRYKPIPNLAETYAQRHESWKDYGQHKPPHTGFLIDTIGWNAAPAGSYGLTLNPATEGGLSWGIWDGRSWHYVNWKAPQDWKWDHQRWYELGVTWGSQGMNILVDGEVKAKLPDVVSVSNTIPWFLGQGPWYWPYGPHSIMGGYDEVRVYGEQIGPYTVEAASAPSGPQPPPAAGSGTQPSPGAPAATSAPPPPRATATTSGPTAQPSAGGEARPQPTAPAVGAAAKTPSTPTPAAAKPGGAAAATQGQPGAAMPASGKTGDAQSGGPAASVPFISSGNPVPMILGGALLVGALAMVVLFLARRRSREDWREEDTAGSYGAPVPSYPTPASVPPAWQASTEGGAKASEPGAAGGSRFCEQCGAPLPPEGRFCEQCGASVDRG